MHEAKAPTLAQADSRPSRVRYAVLGVLCSLAFITYLDRICIAQAQDDIAVALHLNQLTPDDQRRLDEGARTGYASILLGDDLVKLEGEGKTTDSIARRDAAVLRLQDARRNERLSWIFSAFLIGYVLFEIPGGWLGDVWGPRGVILRIVIWWSIFTALTGSVDIVIGWFTTSVEPWLLVAGMVLVRFLFGLGEAGAYPNVGRALARWFPYRERAMAQGFIWTASRIGGALSPPIIIALTTALGDWREAFWLLGIIGAAWAVFFYYWFRDRPEQKESVNSAEAALIKSDAAGEGSVYDDSSHQNVPWRKLVFSMNLWAIYLAAATVSFSWYFNVTFLPKYLKDVFFLDYKESWRITMWPLLVSAPFCYLGGYLSDYLIRRTGSRRWGRSLLGVVGYIGAGIAVFFARDIRTPEGFIVTICIACAIQDLAIPCIWSVGADVGGRYAGTVSGCMNAIGSLGGALGNLLTPYIINAHGWKALLLVNAAVYLFGGIMWLRVNATETVLQKD